MRPDIMLPGQVGRPGLVGKFTRAQLVDRSAWRSIADDATGLGQIVELNAVPAGASCVTIANPLDPGTIDDLQSQRGELAGAWLDRPAGYGRVVPAVR